jgi:hypothetical protein
MYLDGISARYSGHAQWTLPLPISPSAETFINAVLIIGTLSPGKYIARVMHSRIVLSLRSIHCHVFAGQNGIIFIIFIVVIFFLFFYKK